MPEKFTDLPSAAATEVMPGTRIQPLTGEHVQLVHTVIQPGREFAPHRHPHEQFIVVLDGEIEFEIEDERRVLGPMGVFYFAPDAAHGARVVGDRPVTLLEVFAPPREDYREGATAVSHDAPR